MRPSAIIMVCHRSSAEPVGSSSVSTIVESRSLWPAGTARRGLALTRLETMSGSGRNQFVFTPSAPPAVGAPLRTGATLSGAATR